MVLTAKLPVDDEREYIFCPLRSCEDDIPIGTRLHLDGDEHFPIRSAFLGDVRNVDPRDFLG